MPYGSLSLLRVAAASHSRSLARVCEAFHDVAIQELRQGFRRALALMSQASPEPGATADAAPPAPERAECSRCLPSLNTSFMSSGKSSPSEIADRANGNGRNPASAPPRAMISKLSISTASAVLPKCCFSSARATTCSAL